VPGTALEFGLRTFHSAYRAKVVTSLAKFFQGSKPKTTMWLPASTVVIRQSALTDPMKRIQDGSHYGVYAGSAP
jgi:hypothetical protein